jgi:hypothetical protein
MGEDECGAGDVVDLALGIHVYVPDLAAKSRNIVRNFENDRLRVTQATFRAV